LSQYERPCIYRWLCHIRPLPRTIKGESSDGSPLLSCLVCTLDRPYPSV
jgi:hypothetical protein